MKKFLLVLLFLNSAAIAQINPANITIARDSFGVPHIFAPTDLSASTAVGTALLACGLGDAAVTDWPAAVAKRPKKKARVAAEGEAWLGKFGGLERDAAEFEPAVCAIDERRKLEGRRQEHQLLARLCWCFLRVNARRWATWHPARREMSCVKFQMLASQRTSLLPIPKAQAPQYPERL